MADDPDAMLRDPARLLAFARARLPVWTDWGLEDAGTALHSVGVTCWALLGHEQRHVAVADFPAPAQGRWAAVGDGVRVDGVWFHPETREVALLVEFERYGGPDDVPKLHAKARNLLLAHHGFGQRAGAVVLAYWTKGAVTVPEHAALRRVLREGFETAARERVPGLERATRPHFLQFVLDGAGQERLRLVEVLERGTP